MLFPRLTVIEHLWLFARLKGVPSKEIKSEAKNTLKWVGLTHKENDYSTDLSGGEKRKLSLGIAIIGGSKVV